MSYCGNSIVQLRSGKGLGLEYKPSTKLIHVENNLKESPNIQTEIWITRLDFNKKLRVTLYSRLKLMLKFLS